MTDELKPCPFCGREASGEGYVYYSRPCRDTAWDDGSPITEAFFCNCPSCGVNNMATGIGYRSKAEALTAWNTRATPDPLSNPRVKALVEAMKAAQAILNPISGFTKKGDAKMEARLDEVRDDIRAALRAIEEGGK